jgi:LysM repeat protein
VIPRRVHTSVRRSIRSPTLLLPAVTEPDPEQGTSQEPAPYEYPPDGPRRDDALRRASVWLAAAAVLLVIAALAGYGSAYVLANLRAAPSPDAAFMPTPTPLPTPLVTVAPTVGPTAEPTAEPTAQATPTIEPTDQPGPSPTPLEYTVARGDSVSRIALRFGVTPEAIIELNELSNPNRIFPGQVLLIPVAPASPAP